MIKDVLVCWFPWCLMELNGDGAALQIQVECASFCMMGSGSGAPLSLPLPVEMVALRALTLLNFWANPQRCPETEKPPEIRKPLR